jgi:hypothetical protein
MALSDLWSRKKADPVVPSEGLTFADLEEKYDILRVNDEPGRQFAIVAPKAPVEFGSTAPSPWTSFTREEYNTQLQGIRGLEKYDKMRRGDGVVRGTLRAVKTPILSGRFFLDPGGDKLVDHTATDFIDHQLFCYSKSISWIQFLTEALLMLDFGYYMFEKVWDNQIVDGKMRTVLVKLAPRHPMDVKQWEFDAHGGPRGVWMYRTLADQTIVNGLAQDSVFIPIEKLLVFTFDREAGNIEGISVLRSAYKHWYYKEQLYKIDAIQKERHGIGIPVIVLPMGFDEADKLLAEELGRNIRTNEKAHIVLPPMWEIKMLKLEGQPVDALASVDEHNAAIRENVLVNFIRDGAKEDDLVMFYKATKFIADIVTATINTYLIPQMVDLNFTNASYPELKVRRIGESADWRTLSFAVRNLVGAGIIIPDEPLEANLREEMDLPDIDKDSARLIMTPQNPYDMNDQVPLDGGPLNADGTPANPVGSTDQRSIDKSGTDSSGGNTHNNQNPAYQRNRRRRGGKQRPGSAGLPRQTPVGGGGTRNSFGLPRSNNGADGSGGR